MRCSSFSYYNTNTFVFHVDENTQGRVKRMDITVARMYFVRRDEAGNFNQCPVPANLTLHESVTGMQIPVFHDTMFLAWNSSYELRNAAAVVLSLDVQRQLSIRTRLETDCLE